jgi:hypothetical protein
MNNIAEIKNRLLRGWILLLSPIIYLMVLGTFILVKIAKTVFLTKNK